MSRPSFLGRLIEALPDHATLHRLYVNCAYHAEGLGKPPKGCVVVSRGTRVVIEGYPRSANTFAVVAFCHAQRGEVKNADIAHHRHSWLQIAAASKLGIPAMVLIRNPEDAVLSLAIRNPSVSIAEGLRQYAVFYENSYPFRDGFVVAPFEEVTMDFGSIIRKVNERFGTSFREFDHNDEAMRIIFAHIEHIDRMESGVLSEEKVARPSEARMEMKGKMKVEFYSDDLARLRRRAVDIYEKLMASGKR